MKIGDEHKRAIGCGLSGSHRTGKTTVARILAEKNAAPLVESSGTAVAKQMGIKVDAGMPLELRLEFQENVLDVAEFQYGKQNGLFFTDRTPLDFAAYMLVDWHPSLSNPSLDRAIEAYVHRCLEVTDRYFYQLAVIQPGIPYKAEPGKPAPNILYQELLNTTIIGLCHAEQLQFDTFVIPRNVLDPMDRAIIIAKEYGDQMSDYIEHLASRLGIQ